MFMCFIYFRLHKLHTVPAFSDPALSGPSFSVRYRTVKNECDRQIDEQTDRDDEREL